MAQQTVAPSVDNSRSSINAGSNAQNPLVMSYLGLRKAVGIIGFALPFTLAFGSLLLQGSGIRPTISDYYYSHMGNVFVGSLCAIGMFLMSTKGYDKKDEIAGILACIFAVGVALFPTTPHGSPTTPIGRTHLTFAALLFLTLAYFSLVLFTKTTATQPPTTRKLQRNMVYRVCGWTILVCVALIAVLKFSGKDTFLGLHNPVFWFEATAVCSFGLSWLTKGETILKDQ